MAESSFQLKGSLFTLSTLQLKTDDLNTFDNHLSEKIKQAPQFFKQAPVVVDLQHLAKGNHTLDFKVFSEVLNKNQLIPVGVRGGNESLTEQAQAAGLAIMTESCEIKKADANKEKPSVHGENVLITQPIRSGQQVYAQNADLIVIASVSPGAELLADGNIHVYGTLRGRALAGINGNGNARIFCSQLEAELVSIAGQYKTFENIHAHDDGAAKQLYLEDGHLVVASL